MNTSMVASFLVLLLAFPYVLATDFTVGDAQGWTQGVDYTTWASGKTFKVGDNLVFKYGSFHQVSEVDESDYKSCSTSNTIKSYEDGNSKVPLTKAGKIYFICPTPGHCTSTGGMKLEVIVVAATTTPTPSGTPPPATKTPSATPPTTTTPSSSTPSGTNSTSPPPPKDSGSISVSNGISLLMSSLFVSAIVLGLMG